MRPIDKGDIPTDKGQPKAVSHYTHWRKDLVDRIGEYCCYCELKLNESLQVEHVVAQKIDDTLALDWYNLLLACGACNRKKYDNPCPPHTHYLPDVHNTYLAFELYFASNRKQNGEQAAFIKPNANLNANQAVKAKNTIQLCALDKDTTAYPTNRITDLRWRYRFQAFYSAEVWRKEWDDWGSAKANRFVPLLLSAARPTGFFSIWFRVFHDVTPIKKALVEGFPGTALNCFDADNNYNPVWRNQPNEI